MPTHPLIAGRTVRLSLIVLLTTLGRWASAGTLTAPELHEGQYVYTVPNGFIPDKLSVQGLKEIQQTAARLHYPFYVIFVKDLPTTSGRSTEQDTESAIVGLANDWAKNSSFNRNRSTLYLVSYGPGDRKYKMLPAPLWRSELGLESEALKPFNAIFTSNARRDPQSALTKTMTAFDSYVYDHFDPARKAQIAAEQRRQRELAEIERKRREAEARLAQAQNRLDSAVARMNAAIQAEAEFASANADSYQARIEKARAVRAQNNPQAMEVAATDLDQAAALVEGFVAEKRAAAQAEQVRRGGLIVGGTLLFLLVFSLFGQRVRSLRTNRRELTERLAKWREWIQRARERYYLFDENRERAPHLRMFEGRTRELYESTSREIDSIIIGVEAIASLLDSADAKAKRATVFAQAPLREALASLDRPFKYETGQIGNKLFEPAAKTIEITPAAFLADLSERYDAAVKSWQTLNDSVTRSFELPDTLFPHAGLDALLAKAREHGIPDRWLAEHPLIGCATADQSLYAKINECRLTDPYSYALQIDGLKEREAAVSMLLDRLIAAQALAQSHRMEAVTGLSDTILHPEDDPQITLDMAKQELSRIPALLETAESIEVLEAQALKADGLFQKSSEQMSAAANAIVSAASLVAEASSALSECLALKQRASTRFDEVSREHSDVSSVRSSNTAGLQFVESGMRDLSRAQGKLQEKRHLGALRDAKQALSQFVQATERFESALELCSDLDAAKRRYMQKLAEMDSAQAQARQTMRRYNGSVYLIDDYRSPGFADGPLDYAMMYGLLQQQQQHWDMVTMQAQQAYEAAERAQREAQEAARRSQQDSLFSSSSSSTSSWSSSDSGSSGGSFDSGSSSSGSDGGSW